MGRAHSWLAGMMDAAAGRAVKYSRGDASVMLLAVAGRSTFDLADADGTVTKWESKDWILSVDDLVLSRAKVKPAEGDTITEYANGTKYVYEVNLPGGGDAWSYTPDRLKFRIHCKQIQEGTAP